MIFVNLASAHYSSLARNFGIANLGTGNLLSFDVYAILNGLPWLQNRSTVVMASSFDHSKGCTDRQLDSGVVALALSGVLRQQPTQGIHFSSLSLVALVHEGVSHRTNAVQGHPCRKPERACPCIHLVQMRVHLLLP